MQEEHIAYCSHGEGFEGCCSYALDHPAGEKDIVGFVEVGLVEARDADACADDAEEASEEELWSLAIFLCED